MNGSETFENVKLLVFMWISISVSGLSYLYPQKGSTILSV